MPIAADCLEGTKPPPKFLYVRSSSCTYVHSPEPICKSNLIRVRFNLAADSCSYPPGDSAASPAAASTTLRHDALLAWAHRLVLPVVAPKRSVDSAVASTEDLARTVAIMHGFEHCMILLYPRVVYFTSFHTSRWHHLTSSAHHLAWQSQPEAPGTAGSLEVSAPAATPPLESS